MTIGLTHYLFVGAALFACGLFTMMTKRNAIGILIGVELVLVSSIVNFVAFDRYLARLDGQITALFVIVVAAAEAAIAVAICINIYKNVATVDVDAAAQLRG